MAKEEKHGFLNYKHRIIYSLFRAVSRVGMRLSIPLEPMLRLFQMAYFHEARSERGLGLGEVAELFGKSLRTVSSLHNRYRGDFFAPEQELELRRKLAGVVATGPQTQDELCRQFKDFKPIELATALEDLLRERRILRDGDLLRRNPEDHDFFSESDIVARVDGLNRQMDIVAEAVWQRFLEVDSGKPAMARSYVFAGSTGEFEAMMNKVATYIRDRAIEVDDAAAQSGDASKRAITFAGASLEDKT